ncbi:unnamed protein product [Musa hybrid cultivar]
MNSVMRGGRRHSTISNKAITNEDSLMSIIKVCIHRDACMTVISGYEGTTTPEEETPSYLLSSHFPSLSIKIRWL